MIPGAGKVAALAGATLHMSPGKGSMLILNRRMTSAVVNRLAPSPRKLKQVGWTVAAANALALTDGVEH